MTETRSVKTKVQREVLYMGRPGKMVWEVVVTRKREGKNALEMAAVLHLKKPALRDFWEGQPYIALAPGYLD